MSNSEEEMILNSKTFLAKFVKQVSEVEHFWIQRQKQALKFNEYPQIRETRSPTYHSCAPVLKWKKILFPAFTSCEKVGR